MRNENNLAEWTIYLKKDGGVFVYHEAVDGTAGGGLLNQNQARDSLPSFLVSISKKRLQS